MTLKCDTFAEMFQIMVNFFFFFYTLVVPHFV